MKELSPIIIIDYGMGNLGSLANMLKKIHAPAKISSDLEDIESAEKLILPGVGSFDHGVLKLQELNLIETLNKKVVRDKTPILGICLGMQLFTKTSEEGVQQGLGWVDAKTVKFNIDKDSSLKIPHMGWDTLDIKKSHFLMQDTDNNAMYYFVHSFHVVCNRSEDVLSTSHYGYDFVSSLAKDNIIGVQFHPEKSHKYGMKLLENFCNHK
ncbi:MAG: imidazole glycerol phosphate synthase subunit HisH [Methanoregula sp.]